MVNLEPEFVAPSNKTLYEFFCPYFDREIALCNLRFKFCYYFNAVLLLLRPEKMSIGIPRFFPIFSLAILIFFLSYLVAGQLQRNASAHELLE